MLWHSRAVILHPCAWQCDAPASGRSDLGCLKVSSQKESQQPRALVLQGAGAQGQRLDPSAGRQRRGRMVLSLKMKGKIIRAAFLCGEKREV